MFQRLAPLFKNLLFYKTFLKTYTIMNTKHTEGRWNYKIQGFKITVGNSDNGFTKNGHDYTVCTIDDNSLQAEANAKLIAAAPQLLEALKEAMLIIDRISDEYQDLAGRHANYTRGEDKRLNAAIKAATE